MQPRRTVTSGRAWQGSVRVALVVFGLSAMVADIRAQSLADVAAREEARRAAIVTPGPLYTNMPRPNQNAAGAHDPTIPTAARLTSAAAPLKPAVVQSPKPAAAPLTSAARHKTLVVGVATAPVSPPADATRPRPVAIVDPLNASDAAPPAPASIALTGWSAFEIKKTAAEMAETARLADSSRAPGRTRVTDIHLPPQHDVLRLSTGLGYLQGADWGGDLSGSGKVNGMQVDLDSFVTAGLKGFQARSGHVSVIAPNGKLRGEGGNLFSDLRGQARGARASWNLGQTWTPSVSVYLPRAAGGTTAGTVLAYRDRLQLMPHVRVGGELASNGGAFLQVQYLGPRLDLTSFYRVTRNPIAARDKGLSGGLTLGRGVAVSGAIRMSDAVNDSSLWQIASLRLPLARQASLTIERSSWNGGSFGDGSTNALTVQLPMGPVRLIQRVQWGRTDYRHRPVPFGFDRRQSHSSASYTPGRWGSINYQQSIQFFDDGTVQEWDEVSSVLQFGRRTRAQVASAFPNVADPLRFRARVTQRLSPTLELEGQYGRLSAFQLDRASAGETSRVLVTLRKTWQVESPARGGEVRGRALDQAGYIVPGALVRLGPYSAVTDDAGEYRFTRVPDGPFELALDKATLPAAFAVDEQPRPLTVTRGSREHIDLQVIPLNAIRGRVYIDANRNGHWDVGEGVANAVVGVNGSVTATTETGAYAFYNQPPGRYRIRLDVTRLAKGLAPVSPADLDVELTPDSPLIGVDFRVEKRDRPVLMREIGQ